MLRILHFADAHIDIANHGRHDPATGLPLRVLDFLKALDQIVDTAIEEKVDLVVFAGDAYKDRIPAPTFQREWGRRIMRLSKAGIPTLLLVGNHDLSPATGRAHAMQEYDTLDIPNIRVLGKPCFLSPQDLGGLPFQVIALPWVSKSSLMSALELSGADISAVNEALEERLTILIRTWLDQIDPNLPVMLTAHGSVQGAVYGAERSVMLGNDLVLPGSIVKDPRLDYVALGHIHKAQNLNEGAHPPVIYPGSIERVDFGEAKDDKFFVIAHIERGKTTVEWRKLPGRKFVDCFIRLDEAVNGSLPDPDHLLSIIYSRIPPVSELNEAIVRVILEYPRAWETLIDEAALRRYAENAFEFHLIRRPQTEARLRLPNDETISSYSDLQLLDIYWRTIQSEPQEVDTLNQLAKQIIASTSQISQE